MATDMDVKTLQGRGRDWSQVTGDGERLENLLACQLLKY